MITMDTDRGLQGTLITLLMTNLPTDSPALNLYEQILQNECSARHPGSA